MRDDYKTFFGGACNDGGENDEGIERDSNVKGGRWKEGDKKRREARELLA